MAALLGLRRNRVRPHSDRIAALEPRASTSRITTSVILRCMGSVHRPRRSLHWILGAGLALGCGEDPEAAGDDAGTGSETGADTTTGDASSDGDTGAGDTGTGDDDGNASGDDGGDGGGAGLPPPAYDEWVKIELPDTLCGNGSQYKFFANWHEGAENVAVFFEPGGACWDHNGCTGGGLGVANLDGIPDDHMSLWGFTYPMLNRATNSAISDWNLVFIPYCTGDVHTGNNVITYEDPDGVEDDVVFHHAGHANMLAVIDWMNLYFPAIGDLFVSGCSAGGAGTQINYYFLREGTNAERGFALNDSGPIFPNSVNSSPLHQKIRSSWNVDPVIDELPEAAEIKDDFGNINTIIADRWPADRIAITYFMRDYNYSRYSYENFFDNLTQEAIHQLWYEDTELLVAQYEQRDNLAYFIPYYRFLNDSHCATIFAFLGTEIGDENVEDFTNALLDPTQPLVSTIDWDGSLTP